MSITGTNTAYYRVPLRPMGLWQEGLRQAIQQLSLLAHDGTTLAQEPTI